MNVNVRVLGPLRVERDGRAMALGAQARAVLAILALRHATPVPMHQLMDALWGDAPPRSARTHVQGLVSRLRRMLVRGPAAAQPGSNSGRDGSPIATEPAGYVLKMSVSELDLCRFRESAARADQLIAASQPDRAWPHYTTALAQWSGRPCGDLDLPALHGLAEPLVRAHADTLERWATIALDLGHATEVVNALYPAVAQHPFRERLRAQLMTALCRADRAGEALVVYEQGRRILADELGVDPSPPLQELHRDLLAGTPTAHGPHRRAGAWSLPPM